jgi:tetratricopeptide (TPR) repeat protein
MLITDLSSSAKLQVVERERLHEFLKEMRLAEVGIVDPETAQEFGNIAKVDMVLFGSFLKEGDRIEIEAHIIDVATGQLQRVEWVRGKAKDIFKLEKELAFKIIDNLHIELTQEEIESIKYIPTDSIDAATHFYTGLDYYDNGKYPQAFAEFRGAVKQDEDYIKARYWVGRIYCFMGEYEHAIVEYRKITQMYPGDRMASQVQYEIGLIYEERLNNLNKAIEEYSLLWKKCREINLSFKEMKEKYWSHYVFYEKAWEEYITLIRDKNFKPEYYNSKTYHQIHRIRDERTKRYKSTCFALYRTARLYERLNRIVEAYHAYHRLFNFMRWVLIEPNSYPLYTIYKACLSATHRLYKEIFEENEDMVTPPEGMITLDLKDPTYTEDFSTDKRFEHSSCLMDYYIFKAPKGYQIDSVTIEIKADRPTPHYFSLLSYPQREVLRVGGYGARKYKKDFFAFPPGTRIFCLDGIDANKYRGQKEWTMKAELSPLSSHSRFGDLSISTKPCDTMVYLNGRFIYGDNPLVLKGIPVGKYLIKAERPGYESQTKEIVVIPGEETKVNISLKWQSKTRWTEPQQITPMDTENFSLFQDKRGIYRLVFDGLWITSSSDGINWEKPKRLPISFLSFSKSFSNDHYPILIQDLKGKYWLTWMSKRSGHFEIWISTSSDLVNWSHPFNLAKRIGLLLGYSTFAFMQDRNGKFWLIVPEHSISEEEKKKGIKPIFLISTSLDGINWTKPVQVYTKLLEVHVENPYIIQDKNGTYWMVWESSRNVPEGTLYEIYISSSLDGLSWNEPILISQQMGIPSKPYLFQDAQGKYYLIWPSRDNLSVATSTNGAEWSKPQQMFFSSPRIWKHIQNPALIQGRDGEYFLVWAEIVSWPKTNGIWVSKTDSFTPSILLPEERTKAAVKYAKMIKMMFAGNMLPCNPYDVAKAIRSGISSPKSPNSKETTLPKSTSKMMKFWLFEWKLLILIILILALISSVVLRYLSRIRSGKQILIKKC